MRDRRLPSLGVVALACVASCLCLFPRTVQAGPGKYDPKTKQFNLFYTFARLPGLGQAGEPVTPDPAKNQQVLSFLEEVSQKIQTITDGRGKLGPPQLVDSVARADIVVDVAFTSERAAFANLGCLDNAQGQVLFYYNYLSSPDRDRAGVANTVAHELCHYFFGLPDEYNDPRGCPAGALGGRCIMDNYWTMPWYHRACDQDHNQQIVQNNKQYTMPCQKLIDDFFTARGVGSGKTADSETGVPPAKQPDTEEAKLQSIIKDATSAVGKKRGKLTGGLEALRKVAKNLVTQGLKDANITRTEGEVGKAVNMILKAASFAAMPPTDRLRTIVSLLIETGKRVATASKAKDNASKISEVESALLKAAVGNAPDPGKPLSKEDADFVQNLARQVVLSPPDDNGQPKNRDELNYQMLRYLFEAIRDLSAESNPAVARAMSDRIRGLDVLGREFKLPVLNRSRFGARRTMIIAPNPRSDALDPVPLQSGIFSFRTMRNRYLQQFAKLVERNQIQFNTVDLRQRIETREDDAMGGRLSASDRTSVVFNPQPSPPGATAEQLSPTGDVQQLLTKILDEIRKDQLENVAVLIPPGGLGDEVDPLLKEFRKQQLVRTSDIRLDLVVVGVQKIPTLLLDLCHRSGGTVLTIGDVQETGAIAQRLKNEQSAGSWVTFPRVYDLPCGAERAKQFADMLRGQGDINGFLKLRQRNAFAWAKHQLNLPLNSDEDSDVKEILKNEKCAADEKKDHVDQFAGYPRADRPSQQAFNLRGRRDPGHDQEDDGRRHE